MSVTPLYGKIADDLRQMIISGDLAPGDRLPSEREICERYGVSHAVARQAIAYIRQQGLAVSHQGKGSFVSERREYFRNIGSRYGRGFKPNLRESEEGGWTTHVTSEFSQIQATDYIASRLDLSPGEMVTQVIYRWLTDGEVTEKSIQWEPLNLIKGTPIETPSSGDINQPDVLTRFDSIGIHVDEVKEEIRTRMPTPEEMQEMRIPVGVPVFEIQRTHLSFVPVETAIIVLRGDKWVLRNNQVVPVENESA
ncbi:GntR family transcriptional regulator [Nonomuraea endophytica]|uniref:GntR family transcriptional regulator n=1 Tax=Nonomuraea endophytica TaxID=714136 RepID=A0A7W8EFK4_9ACTN|nr:GntR family transcriptional regulator [Nonomuraea endophytica]MBB5078865.1 GntR family transcriptional regulator [Nonomuraea endophytica]